MKQAGAQLVGGAGYGGHAHRWGFAAPGVKLLNFLQEILLMAEFGRKNKGDLSTWGFIFFPCPSPPSPWPRLAVAVFGDASALSFGHHKEPEEEKCELRKKGMCQKQAPESLAVISVGVGWEIWTVPKRFGDRSAIPYCHFRMCIWKGCLYI